MTVGALALFMPLYDLISYWGDHTVRNVLLVLVSIPLLTVSVLVHARDDTNAKAQPNAPHEPPPPVS